MKSGALFVLARPAAPADRARAALLAGSTSVAGALLLAAARIARYDGERVQVDGHVVTQLSRGSLAPYVEQDGLRPGVVLGTLLLAVPVFALMVQSLRTGSLARERRLASLRLAGATPGDVRRVSAAEAAGGALIGGLLAGPMYIILWVLLGVLPASDLRLLPTPTPLDLPLWLAATLGLCIAGGVAGSLVEPRVLVDPIDVTRRSSPNRVRSLWWAVVGVAVAVVAVDAVRRRDHAGVVVLAVAVGGVLVAAFSGGTRYAHRRGRQLAARGGAVALLAGARLVADPRPAGRVAGVLGACGIALGIEAVSVSGMLAGDTNYGEGLGFYLTGYALAGAGVLVAVVVAVLTLLVGAADQLIDARRPLASLSALGVDDHTVQHALRRQLTAASVPAVVVGVVIGGLLIATLTRFGDGAGHIVLPLLLAAATLAGLVVSLVGRLAARLLRRRVRAATDPENLRVA